MPTSTIWRRDTATHTAGGTSPTRPIHDIERISPEPSFSPSWQQNTVPVSSDHNLLHGLGLSHSALAGRPHTKRAPEQLYIDRNGSAYVRNSFADPRSNQDYTSPPSDPPARQSRPNRNPRISRTNGHSRSRSGIDDLAEAAIATSPTFANASPSTFVLQGSPSSYTPARPSTSHLSHYGFHDNSYHHPAKRVKSERLPNIEWAPQHPRPVTSYQHITESSEEEVSLLLGLRNEVNFKTNKSPVTASVPIQLSPEPYDLPYSPVTHVPQVEKQERSGIGAEDTMAQTSSITPDVTGVGEELQGANSTTASHSVFEHDNTSQQMPKQLLASAQPLALEHVAPKPVPSVEESLPPIEMKKRRVKPQVQAEVCAECNKLQRDVNDDDQVISWIQCDACKRWFHAMCAGFKSKTELRSLDKFVCSNCEPEHGSTTFVRKSSRARTAIDYAELNQGLVKSSVENSMHHYIQPIRAGQFSVHADDFARVRPELLTAEFMEHFDNMKRPFVVPACWNPRFGMQSQPDAPSDEEIQEQIEYFDSSGTRVDTEPGTDQPEQLEEVIDCEQDLLDMIMPRGLTVRKVAELYGKYELVPVIDVKTQETKGNFTLEQWADYYEEPGEKPIRNVISLEVSESPLGRLIRRPKVVRDLDLEDMVWDPEARSNQKKRPVQFYCLMSVADSYTDFHIDFGGSSVYYHILKGTKTFFFIPPEDRYLKKYEEWCNSQTQNGTWLPDLCGGNVTRVDLHEGDTAFIPAGWIHSVWTPEDSLVIGGNFLTRIDYELQLKVVQVEKVTKVAPKFRYPYFQKVMWYVLIKYLEEDPVPDEVMEDFQEDPEHIFLRANPVWHELQDLENHEDPGSPLFNARYYPKTEIRGLPALRDYLYRTARIASDLPVENINKRQVEAVKASVPKGHGDPLVLIKTFAIWCAWKIGEVAVPSWVYSDAGGFPEVEKKVKKAERVRLPGERTSLRRATESVPRETTGPAVITPYKPGFNAAGVNSDPTKKAKPAARPAGAKLTPGRVACDACRRRRVKCKHKDGEGSAGDDEKSASRSQTPDAPIRPTSEQPMQYETPIKASSIPVLASAAHEPVFMTSELAQAALASLDGNGEEANASLVDRAAPSSGKKSRSKACEECRKSKRRCVHDEHGRVDPAKAAEPSKPRGSSSIKRPARPSNEGMQVKRPKIDTEQPNNIDALIDPALFHVGATQDPWPQEQEFLLNGISENPSYDQGAAVLINTELHTAEIHAIGVVHEATPVATQAINGETAVKMESDRDIPMTGVEAHQNGIAAPNHLNEDAIDDGCQLSPQFNGVAPRKSSSPMHRHSSRQLKQVERYIPQDHRSPTKVMPKPAPNDRRGSSAVSGQLTETSVKSRRSSSNTSGTIHQIAPTVATKADTGVGSGSRESTVESELDADEKLARELQAEEHGLRRRASMRQ